MTTPDRVIIRVVAKSEILSHCIKNLESFKVPREIEFVNDFSSNEFGKMKHFRGE